MNASVDTLLTLLDLEELGPGRRSVHGEDVTLFEGQSDDFGNEHMFGGHVMAQGIIAAGRTVRDGDGAAAAPHSLHAYFMRPGDVHAPIRFVVEHLRDGSSFRVRSVHAVQHGERIFTANVSFHTGAEGFEHQDPPPHAPGPQGLPTTQERFETARSALVAQWPPSVAWGVVDERFVTPDVYLTQQPANTPEQITWLRVPGAVPDDELIQAALLSYACDLSLFMPGVRRHGMTASDPNLRMATIDHAMWFHRPVRIDDWMLYSARTPSGQDGRSLSTGKIFQNDQLVATVAQEGMLWRKEQ